MCESMQENTVNAFKKRGKSISTPNQPLDSSAQGEKKKKSLLNFGAPFTTFLVYSS